MHDAGCVVISLGQHRELPEHQRRHRQCKCLQGLRPGCCLVIFPGMKQYRLVGLEPNNAPHSCSHPAATPAAAATHTSRTYPHPLLTLIISIIIKPRSSSSRSCTPPSLPAPPHPRLPHLLQVHQPPCCAPGTRPPTHASPAGSWGERGE
jgi:hypothetical protein